jgi:hypothetical protein
MIKSRKDRCHVLTRWALGVAWVLQAETQMDRCGGENSENHECRKQSRTSPGHRDLEGGVFGSMSFFLP